MNRLFSASFRSFSRTSLRALRFVKSDLSEMPTKRIIRNIAIGTGASFLSVYGYFGVYKNSSLQVYQYLFADKGSLIKDKDLRTAISLAILDVSMQPHGTQLVSKSNWGHTLTNWILSSPEPKTEIITVLSHLCSIDSKILKQALLSGGMKVSIFSPE